MRFTLPNSLALPMHLERDREALLRRYVISETQLAADTYLAVRASDGQRVAYRSLANFDVSVSPTAPGDVTVDPSPSRMLLREDLTLLFDVLRDSPFFARVVEFGDDISAGPLLPPSFRIITEFVPGRSLRGLLLSSAPRLPDPARAQRYFFQLLSAIDLLHRAGGYHSALSLDNVIIDSRTDCVVVDDVINASKLAAPKNAPQYVLQTSDVRRCVALLAALLHGAHDEESGASGGGGSVPAYAASVQRVVAEELGGFPVFAVEGVTAQQLLDLPWVRAGRDVPAATAATLAAAEAEASAAAVVAAAPVEQEPQPPIENISFGLPPPPMVNPYDVAAVEAAIAASSGGLAHAADAAAATAAPAFIPSPPRRQHDEEDSQQRSTARRPTPSVAAAETMTTAAQIAVPMAVAETQTQQQAASSPAPAVVAAPETYFLVTGAELQQLLSNHPDIPPFVHDIAERVALRPAASAPTNSNAGSDGSGNVLPYAPSPARRFHNTSALDGAPTVGLRHAAPTTAAAPVDPTLFRVLSLNLLEEHAYASHCQIAGGPMPFEERLQRTLDFFGACLQPAAATGVPPIAVIALQELDLQRMQPLLALLDANGFDLVLAQAAPQQALAFHRGRFSRVGGNAFASGIQGSHPSPGKSLILQLLECNVTSKRLAVASFHLPYEAHDQNRQFAVDQLLSVVRTAPNGNFVLCGTLNNANAQQSCARFGGGWTDACSGLPVTHMSPALGPIKDDAVLWRSPLRQLSVVPGSAAVFPDDVSGASLLRFRDASGVLQPNPFISDHAAVFVTMKVDA